MDRRSRRASPWIWALAFGALALALALLLEPVDLPSGLHGPDGRNYLSQLNSLLFDGDLLLYNNNAALAQRILVTPTGYALELHNIGTALAFLPFHAAGHMSCLVFGGSCDGRDLATGIWLSLGNWAYGLLALVVTWRLVVRHTSPRWATLAVVALALGSPFFYYWTRFFNPHMPALFLLSLFTLVWDRTRDERRLRCWALLGLIAGAAASIASYHIVVLILPACDWVLALARRRSPSATHSLQSVVRHLLSASVLFAGAVAGFAPQLVTWKMMFGSLLGTPYGQQLFWLQPGLSGILFSSYHGLYFYTPLLLVATLAFIPLFRRDWRMALPLLLAFAATVYAASCNIAWWAGAAFGSRYLLGTLPWLALPLAVLLARVRWRAVLYVVMAACIAWTYGLFLADFGRLVDPGQYVPAAWHLRVQAAVWDDLPALLRQHLLSPRFALAPAVALPGALLLLGPTWLAGRAHRMPGRGLLSLLLALPLLVATLLVASDDPSRREIARLDGEGFLESLPRASFDHFDLSEGYWQRGTYRFVRGDRTGAVSDWATAQQLDPTRRWVRIHAAGLEKIPHRLELAVADAPLTFAGWGVEGEALALYWLAGSDVLSPTYRTALSLKDAAGLEAAFYTPQAPDAWRALSGDLVRTAYPVPPKSALFSQTLVVQVYTADASRLVDSLDVTLHGQ